MLNRYIVKLPITTVEKRGGQAVLMCNLSSPGRLRRENNGMRQLMV